MNVVESFLPLTDDEEVALWTQLREEGVWRMEASEVPWDELTWADRMVLRGERKALLRQLRQRFGEAPEALVAQIEAADATTLDEMLDPVVTAASLEEFQRSTGH